MSFFRIVSLSFKTYRSGFSLWGRGFPLYVQYPKSLLLALIGSLFLWVICYPGFMSWDSIYQYREAMIGTYTDWHPPIMAFILSLVFRMGGDVWTITLLQSVAGWMGIRSLSLSVAHMVLDQRSDPDRIASIVSILLFSPLSPLPVFTLTFWKDTWLAILLVWCIAILFHVALQLHKEKMLFSTSLIVFGLLTGLAGVVRHNGIVITAVASLAMAFIPLLAHQRRLLLLAPIPLLVFGLVNTFQLMVLKPRKMHPEQQVYAISLVSMVKLNPRLLDVLPFTRANLHSDFQSEFRIGDTASAFIYGEKTVVERAFTDPMNISILRDEFLRAIKADPRSWFRAQWITYVDFLRPKQRYTLHPAIEPNEFGLALNTRFSIFRERMLYLTAMVENGILRWFFFVHLPWYLLDFLGILLMLGRTTLTSNSLGQAQQTVITFGLLIPFSYSLSYFVVVTAPDFRFMYPSTLVVQVIFCTYLLCRILQSVEGHHAKG
uniref:Glycosyltransferase RgtA/B/C/D-like domain-containing protein n=1 Tax=uncultured Chloroflexota bacterium TaxID=166587 RepID=H5SBC6_9CHLR|nr:hypothetical protein HGMM_F07B11C17 [uncultured Chloroflexota bacterium]